MAERLGLAVTWEAVPSSSLTLAAARPPSCLLDGRRIAMVGLQPLPAWQESLDQYLAQAASKGNNP